MQLTQHSLPDHRLRNLLRGAQANTDSHVRRTTINNARRILNPNDAAKFAEAMCQSDLDDFYFGPAYPDSPDTIFRTPYRRVTSLNTECAIQSARLRFHQERLVTASESLGRISTAILSGDLAKACSLCKAFIIEYGYSATIARKVIYLNLLATHQTQDSEHADAYRTQANELLQPFFSPRASRQYAQFINLTIDICDKDIECFETMQEHMRLLRESLASSEKFPPHYAMMRRIVFPTNYHSIIDPISLLYFSSSSAIDLLVDLTTASHSSCEVPPVLQNLYSEQSFFYAQKHLQPSTASLCTFVELSHVQGPEQAAYRASAIFPEVATFARWASCH